VPTVCKSDIHKVCDYYTKKDENDFHEAFLIGVFDYTVVLL